MLISTNSGLYSARPGKPRFDMCEAMDFFAEAGFEAVDVNFCAVIYDGFRHEPVLDGDWKENIKRLEQKILEDHLTVSHTHLPFYHYEPAKEPLCFQDQMMYRAIEASAMLGAPFAVVHPLCGADGKTLIDATVELLAPFCRAASERGVVLALENMRTTSPQELAEMADRLGCAVCWDVGHCNLGGFDQGACLRLLGSRIKVLHLHDNYGAKDDHNAPYFGTIDWEAFMELLREIGYEGTFNYEVNASRIPEKLRMEHARYLVKAARLLLGRES